MLVRIAEFFRIEREKQNMTCSELARHAGLEHRVISRLEGRGGYIHNPTLKTLLKMCNGLKISPGRLFRYLGKGV